MADKDISPDKDGKLIKKIISEGVGEGQPKQGDEVFVLYTGRLSDGTVFDSSVERNELFKFKLGEGKVTNYIIKINRYLCIHMIIHCHGYSTYRCKAWNSSIPISNTLKRGHPNYVNLLLKPFVLFVLKSV